MRPRTLLLLLLLTFLPATQRMAGQSYTDAYIVVTDYLKADGLTDVADEIQQIIDDNPNRTLFFPDGTYLISHSILTPADPTKSVHLVLSNFAVIKAAENWQGDALIRLGGKLPFNTIRVNGSNYGLEGGILDGSSVANGVSIDSGRETRICRVAIKNTQVGVHVRWGANSGSCDCDVSDVNVVGNGDPHSVGVLVEAYDNTFTNMRICGCNVGVWLKKGGNSLRNIHPLSGADYMNSYGFIVEESNCWLDYCYSDHFAHGFKLSRGVRCHFAACWAWWYAVTDMQVAIECDGPLESYFYGFRTGFKHECPHTTFLKAEKGGAGCIRDTAIPDLPYTDDDVTASYVAGK